MRHFYATACIFTAIFATMSACTSYDDTPSAKELANAAASANYKSQNGDLAFKPDGTTTFKGQNLIVGSNANGQNIYNNITINGQDFTLITAQTGTGTAIYALRSGQQFADIGNSIPKNTALNAITAKNFAGKYFERAIGADGAISSEYSGTILFEFNPSAGTLTSISGTALTGLSAPIAYLWDAASQSFIGASSTTGSALSYTDNTMLGHYTQPNITATGGNAYGSFWTTGQ